jgi:hypothetical protein
VFKLRWSGFWLGVRLDLLNVPLRDGVAGGVLCIAALHHLATEARRIEAVAGKREGRNPLLLIFGVGISLSTPSSL